MKQLHDIQLGILGKLLFADTLRYTQMKPSVEIENNTYDFHVKQLLQNGLIVKKDNRYSLTDKGKEYANRMDTDTNKIETQAKISVWICCLRERNGKSEVLIGTRLKQPFYGKQGFIAGKVKLGESILEAAARELSEETSMQGNPELVIVRHYRVYAQDDNRLLEDKFMFLCKMTEPEGDTHSNNEVKLEWIAVDEVKTKVQNPFEDIEHLLQILQILHAPHIEGIRFEELSYSTDSF